MFENRDLWLKQLSASLKDNGQVAYLWNIQKDSFEFMGDTEGLFGLQEDDMPSSREQVSLLINPQDIVERQLEINAAISRCAGKSEDFKIKYRLRQPDGSQVPVIENGMVLINFNTNEKTVQGVIGRNRAAEILNPSSGKNSGANISLALVPNAMRRVLQNQLEEYLDNREDKSRGYFLLAGIDHLSVINEAYGPQVADELIEQTEKRLAAITNGSATVTKLQGDMFGLFFRTAPLSEMSSTAYGILKAFYSQPFQVMGQTVNNMVSIGGVPFDIKQLNSASVLTYAELALREAKQRGRGCFISYVDDMSKGGASSFRDYLAIGDQFLKAFRDGRVHLAYQKIVNSTTEETSFYECLIRLIDEDGQSVAAGQFINAVEKMGMTRLVDNFSTSRAIQELRIFPDLRLSINVSNHSFSDPQWLFQIQNDLRRSPEVASRLIIEITESFAMDDVANTIRVIKILRELGCQIALDDFGTGYTSFVQLRDLKLDMVKIDKSFVQNINEDNNMLFINTLQSLAGGMKIQTVGEGAETLADAKLLSDGGINHIQGYAFSVPSMERIWLPQDDSLRFQNFKI